MPTYRDQIIDAASFEEGEEVRAYVGSKQYPDGLVIENGTVEVTLHGKTKRVRAFRNERGTIYARGLGGRYQTSSKVWPAMVSTDARGTYVFFGRDDRSDRFNKASGLFFMKEGCECA